ncbi:hypothetical protein AD998_05830 [bacterium 336/3]|nr:hypothetical protein AD998_05830 [bacterium 336/3]
MQTKIFKISDTGSTFLDSIRFIAAQMVVIGHGISFFNIFPKLQPPFMPYIQNIGVMIFFVISGFLITYSSILKVESRQESYSFKEYFIERFGRIYSGLIPSLIFIVLLDYTLLSKDYNYIMSFNIKTFIGNLFMLQDYPYFFDIISFGSGRPLWTLAIEWWLYMIFGWLLLSYRKNVLFFLAITIILGLVPYYHLFWGNGLTITWLIGVCVFYLLQNHHKNNKNNKDILFCFIFILLGSYRIYITKNAYDISFAFCIGAVIFFILRYTFFIQVPLLLKYKRIIKFLASYSFILYLTHYSIIEFLLVFTKSYNPYVMFCMSIIVSNLVALSIALPTEMKYKRLVQKMKKQFL